MPKLTLPSAMSGPEFAAALKYLGLSPVQFAGLAGLALSSVYSMRSGRYRIPRLAAVALDAWRVHPDLIPAEYRPTPTARRARTGGKPE